MLIEVRGPHWPGVQRGRARYVSAEADPADRRRNRRHRPQAERDRWTARRDSERGPWPVHHARPCGPRPPFRL